MTTQYATSGATLDYNVSDQWGDGFVGRLEVTFAEGTSYWRVTFQLDAEIENIWNARIVSHVGDTYVVEGLSYNSNLGSGGSANFGFLAKGTDTTIDPASVAINDNPVVSDPVDPDPVDPDPVDPDPVDPDPVDPTPPTTEYIDITEFGSFHGSSSHTDHSDLHGGRTAITTEALVAYNGLRNFLGYQDLELETIGQWAFDNDLTNNDQAWGQDLMGVGLYYAMQGAKVGWIRDDAFDPQLIADIQRTARLGDPADVMAMVEANSREGFADYLIENDLVDIFINTLKMEPHYGGWMHGRVHGDLVFPDGDGARSHDVNHLTVLSHDQTQPFMNDTFDWPQWGALDVPHQDVIDYFQSMVVLGDPHGDALPSGTTPDPVDPDPVDPDPVDPDPVDPDPVDPDPVDPDPVDPDPVDPDPVDPTPPTTEYIDITEFGSFHGSSSHTDHSDLHGGRTAITTEALVAYNGLRNFLGYQDLELETIGQWAFDNDLTNNDQAWGQDLMGVGLYYAMQGAKVGWIRDDAFDPQLIADIQRTARLGDPADVMAMVEANSHEGFADYLIENDLVDIFINTLKMEPHYGGWMHGRVHGDLVFPDGDGARSHDVNHLTVLSHDQTQPFMNDTFDWPQWGALDVPHQDVIDYFQSMVVLGDPLGDALPSGTTPDPVDPDPVDPDPVDPDPVDPDPVDPGTDAGLSAEFFVVNDWGHGATLNIVVSNNGTEDVSDWDLEFNLGSDIQHIWNAVIETQTGDRFSIDDAGWNSTIEAGGSVTVGFNTTTGGFDEVQLNEDAQFLF